MSRSAYAERDFDKSEKPFAERVLVVPCASFKRKEAYKTTFETQPNLPTSTIAGLQTNSWETYEILPKALHECGDMANQYKQWTMPAGKQAEELLSHDWWYVYNIGCEKDPFHYMTLEELKRVNVVNRADALKALEEFKCVNQVKPTDISKTLEEFTVLLQSSSLNETLVADVVSMMLIEPTIIEADEIVRLVMVNGTEFQIARMIEQLESTKTIAEVQELLVKSIHSGTVVEIANLYAVAIQESSPVFVKAITDALVDDDIGLEKIPRIVSLVREKRKMKEVPHLEFSIKGLENKFMVGMSEIDYWDRTQFKWTVMRIKAARATGNKVLENQLKAQFSEELTLWLITDSLPDLGPELDE